MSLRRLLAFVVLLGGGAALLYGLNTRIAGGPPLKTLLDPADGLYRTARQAVPPAGTTRVGLPRVGDSVTVVRDSRHVPHIYAESDSAATMALGYVLAQDRLFQLDFLPRVASGRLAEAFGARAVDTDRFLRRTGMEWGARKNLKRIREAGGLEHDLLRWYARGVNAYLDDIAAADLPLEFRLLGYAPDRYTPLQGLRLLQYMTFDLTYNTDDPAYTRAQNRLSASEYQTLYPEHPTGLFDPIVPPSAQGPVGSASSEKRSPDSPGREVRVASALQERTDGLAALARLTGIGPHPGTGSNNWAVTGERSTTGAPLLAGDMHLSLSLPSIWYEAHLVTPTTNAYGLTIPGAPVLVQAFNEHVGWTMTNTGADQIDHYALTLDSSRTRYRFEGEWRSLHREVDTIHVNRGAPVLDTLYYSHHGPVHRSKGGERGAIAERWVAHDTSRTMRALWQMNRATSMAEVHEALRDWDAPMQNVLYAGTGDSITIRSAGHLPVRGTGEGRGLLDGTTDAARWTGRVPFDSLPAAQNPSQQYLASANQVPTGAGYPYYLGHDWGDGYRSLRINELLRGAEEHSIEDFQRYQADVQVQQQDVFVPLLETVDGLSRRADTLRQMLRSWDGEATVDRPEPLVMDEFLRALRRRAWDEAVFATAPTPEDAVLVDLLRNDPTSRWLDVQATAPTEEAQDLLAYTLNAVADTMEARYGWAPEDWRWGDHHRLRIDHLSNADALRPLGRGPFEYPGFEATLRPGRGRTVTHSASQQVIIDFSMSPPTGLGVYPGGQSGRPLNREAYDAQLPAYLDGKYYEYRLSTGVERGDVRSVLRLRPGAE